MFYKNKKAFTLIELLVVISVIGLLSSLTIVALNSSRQKARDAKRVADIRQIRTAIDFYYNNHGYFPEYLTATHCSVRLNALRDLVTEGLFAVVPDDPKYDSTVTPRKCYNYMGLGNKAKYPSGSGLRCDGRIRTDYQWSLLFSTEKESFDFERETSNNYTYCVHGPLLMHLQ